MKKIFLQIVYSIIAIVGCIFFISPSSFAQEQKKTTINIVNVNPAIINTTVKPGTETQQIITITNLLDQELLVTTTFEPLESFPQLTNFVNLDKKTFVINPKAKSTITLKITIPNGKKGGYYGLLFIQPQLSSASEGTPLNAKVGIPLLINSSEEYLSKFNARINEFTFSKKFFDEEPIQLQFDVTSRSIHHFTAKPILTIKPLFGNEEKFFLEEKFIFPGQKRNWRETITISNHFFGFYSAQLGVSIGNGEQLMIRNYFISFPLKKSLPLFIFFIIILFVIIKRKRVKKAFKILLKS